MSVAYRSAVDLSFKVRAGLLMRQTHHWAADVFVASIVLHMLRVFFTGAFRKPRDLTYYLGLTMLVFALLEGYLGYSLVDDLLSGMGLAIGYSVLMSVPFVGANLALLVWGAPFPGKAEFWSRMYVAHVFLLPILIATLLALHLFLVAARHHTQFRESRRTTEKKVVGIPTFPGYAPRSLGLFFSVAAVLFLLGGLVQINPIWLWGPYHVAQGTNGAQPDWYLGWLIGALRLVPNFDVTIGDYTLVPNAFWGGALFPLRRSLANGARGGALRLGVRHLPGRSVRPRLCLLRDLLRGPALDLPRAGPRAALGGARRDAVVLSRLAGIGAPRADSQAGRGRGARRAAADGAVIGAVRARASRTRGSRLGRARSGGCRRGRSPRSRTP